MKKTASKIRQKSVIGGQKIGASEGIRTLDIHLGKVTLYQTELRSLPDDPNLRGWRNKLQVGKLWKNQLAPSFWLAVAAS
jgi:hypothetical protein